MNVDDKGDLTRQGIDVMTAWTTADDDPAFMTSRVLEYVAADPDYGAIKLALGLINVAGALLLALESAADTDMRAILQALAQGTLKPRPPRE